MARKKAYIEEQVIEKAMNLFWRNGYESTSVRMLENEMGINQFSIYASFGSKQGVFKESIKCYKGKLKELVNDMEASHGKAAIKAYFYAFNNFAKKNIGQGGCLINNTFSELGTNAPEEVMTEMMAFVNELKAVFQKKLRDDDATSSHDYLAKQASFLLVAIQGMVVASKVMANSEIENFVEMTFSSL